MRVHSNCLTGDVFGSERCDCGPQLASAISRIGEEASGGYLIYMAGHEGRGYWVYGQKLPPTCCRTRVRTPIKPTGAWGCRMIVETFTDAAVLLKRFMSAKKPFRLYSPTTPRKLEDLAEHGLELRSTREKHVTGVGEWNKRYLNAKRDWGHGSGGRRLCGNDAAWSWHLVARGWFASVTGNNGPSGAATSTKFNLSAVITATNKPCPVSLIERCLAWSDEDAAKALEYSHPSLAAAVRCLVCANSSWTCFTKPETGEFFSRAIFSSLT